MNRILQKIYLPIFLNKLLLVITLTTFVFSCKTKEDKLAIFKSFKSNVSNEVLKNFPINEENFENPYVITVVNPSIFERRYAGVFMTYQFELEKEFEKEIAKISKNAKHILEINQNQYLTIPDSLSKIGHDKPFVPSLKDSLNFLNRIVNPEKSRYAVFEQGKGNYFRPPFEVPDKEYDNQGFSNGCIIDKKNMYLTYWVLAW